MNLETVETWLYFSDGFPLSFSMNLKDDLILFTYVFIFALYVSSIKDKL